MADLILIRKWFSTKSTIGDLYFTDPSGAEHFITSVLEDEARPPGVKIQNHTCIPAGDYKLQLTMSSRFGRILPLIYNDDASLSVKSGNVKWEGIRLHPGNTDADTEGCLLPGQKGRDIVLNSREAYSFVEAAIKSIMKKKNTKVVSLKIINNQTL
jgi:hypothetical protein